MNDLQAMADKLAKIPTGPHNITREDLMRLVAKKTGYSQTVTHEILTTLIDELIQQFHAGNPIELRGFGTFYPYFKGARKYVIPRSKEERVIKGRTTLKFKPSRQILLYKD